MLCTFAKCAYILILHTQFLHFLISDWVSTWDFYSVLVLWYLSLFWHSIWLIPPWLTRNNMAIHTLNTLHQLGLFKFISYQHKLYYCFVNSFDICENFFNNYNLTSSDRSNYFSNNSFLCLILIFVPHFCKWNNISIWLFDSLSFKGIGTFSLIFISLFDCLLHNHHQFLSWCIIIIWIVVILSLIPLCICFLGHFFESNWRHICLTEVI